ncbi:MAG: Gfo/Idh/MocA family oxidoreductase [Treponema sp.]|nr:Gfo/Idh/MocA family oxidoreductase [Treponema sp.]
METVKWGVLGTANIARGCTIPGLKLAKNAELYAIAGRSLEKAKSFADEFGFKKYYGSYVELLQDKDVQAVYIPLPNNLHLQWVIAALNAKKHVLCEKPLALNAYEAEQMFSAAKENGVCLMEAYAYLHSPYIKSLKDDIKSGIIGDVDFIDTAFVTQGYKEDIRLYKELGGGAMYDLGCYCTTMILSLVNSEPQQVRAVAEFTDKGVDAITTGFIRFKNGVHASFNVGMILGTDTNGRFDRLFIHGTKGCIKSDIEYNQAGELSYTVFTDKGAIERKVSVPQNYSLETEQLGNCILSGETPFVTPEFSIKNSKLIDSVMKEIGF